jgi:hypothetical protein
VVGGDFSLVVSRALDARKSSWLEGFGDGGNESLVKDSQCPRFVVMFRRPNAIRGRRVDSSSQFVSNQYHFSRPAQHAYRSHQSRRTEHPEKRYTGMSRANLSRTILAISRLS